MAQMTLDNAIKKAQDFLREGEEKKEHRKVTILSRPGNPAPQVHLEYQRTET